MKKVFIIIASCLMLASCGDKQPKGTQTTTDNPRKL